MDIRERPEKTTTGPAVNVPEANPAAQGPLPREAYSLLAQANLYRIRGCWAEAIENCMAALRLAPEHPSAQSLLGDIYENQGRLDDAIQWYRMALDVQPDSPADQFKLQRLLAAKASSIAQKASAQPASSEPALPPSSGMRALAGQWRTNPDRWLRRAATFSGVLALLVIVLALSLTHGGGAATWGGSARRQLDAPPVTVPAVSGAVAPLASDGSVNGQVGDPLELNLQATLRSAPSLAAQSVTLVGVQSDPRSGWLTMTAICQPHGPTVVSRGQILRDATCLLQTAAQSPTTAQFAQMTVRCLLASPGGGSTPLVFTADTTRAGVAALNPSLFLVSNDQIASAYSNVWWSPAVPQ